MISLTDDGTLDTVLRCDTCAEEFRFNFDSSGDYDAWVEECVAEVSDEHTCEVE